MSKSQKKNQTQKKKQSNKESTASKDKKTAEPLGTIEIITSLWVLSLVFLTVGNIIMLITMWLAYSSPDWKTIEALYRVSVMGNLIVSLTSLIMMTIVLRRRPVAPPKAVTIYGVIFCLLPIAVTVNLLIN